MRPETPNLDYWSPALRLLVGCVGFFFGARVADPFPFANAQKASATTETLTKTDADVIEAIVSSWNDYRKPPAGDKKVTCLAIVMECDPGEVKNGSILPTGLVDAPSTATILQNLWERNVRAFRLRESVARGSLLIIGNKTTNRLVEEKTFRKRFPNLKDYNCFWLPGYDATGTKAAVYYWWPGYGDGLSGAGYMVYLERQDGVWKVVKSDLAWQS